jgi:hypothetical protein
MITREELMQDPWSTYPVKKADLYLLLHVFNAYRQRDEHPDRIEITGIHENFDGSMMCDFVLGRNVAEAVIKHGLITILTNAAKQVEEPND